MYGRVLRIRRNHRAAVRVRRSASAAGLELRSGNFIRDVLRGGPVRIGGDGTPLRSYLYAADLAIWLWTILLRGKPAYPYNVGSSHDLTIADLAQTVVRVPHLKRVSRSPGSQSRVCFRCGMSPRTRRAEEELGLHPLIPIEHGVRRTFEWHRADGPGHSPA